MNNDKDSKPTNDFAWVTNDTKCLNCGARYGNHLYNDACRDGGKFHAVNPKIEPVEPEKQESSFTEWLKSEEGRTCAQGTATGKYLENRLWWAYHAGQENAASLEVTEEQIKALKKAIRILRFEMGKLDHASTLEELESILTNQKPK